MERGIVILNEVKDLTWVLRAASALLAGLSHYPSIASSPRSQVKTVGLLSPKSQVKTVGRLVNR
jgi:hypothetical protein